MKNQSITVSKKGIVVTVSFPYGGNNKRIMRITSNFITRLVDQLLSRTGILRIEHCRESAAPAESEVEKMLKKEEAEL